MDTLHAKKGYIYIIGLLLRPGTLSFATDLEHECFPPETSLNELYNIFQLKFQGMPYYIIEVPVTSMSVAEKMASRHNLKLVNGKPVSNESESFGLVCSAETCFTLEIADYNKVISVSSQLLCEQEIVKEKYGVKNTE